MKSSTGQALCMASPRSRRVSQPRPPGGAPPIAVRGESSSENPCPPETPGTRPAIKVRIWWGVATLRGTVARESHKVLAQKIAANWPGVRRVDNQVKTVAEVIAAEAAHVDRWIGWKAELAGIMHLHVGFPRTLNDVKASDAQKGITTACAGSIEGVTAAATRAPVISTAREKIVDRSMAAQATILSLSQRSTSVIT